MKGIGDAYVKSEFRLHKSGNAEQVQQFYSAWEQYLQQILSTARARESAAIGALDSSSITNSKAGNERQPKPEVFQFGANLPHDIELSNEQNAQLTKLKAEVEKASRSH